MHTHFDFLYLLLSLAGLCRTENIHINGHRRGDIPSPSSCDSIGPYWHGFLHSLLPSTWRGKKCIFSIVSLSPSVRPSVYLSPPRARLHCHSGSTFVKLFSLFLSFNPSHTRTNTRSCQTAWVRCVQAICPNSVASISGTEKERETKRGRETKAFSVERLDPFILMQDVPPTGSTQNNAWGEEVAIRVRA